MVYFSDFLNAKNIADIKQIPMRSQWMHGMFATDNSWESGTWLLSNNLLFPPTKDSNLVSPESRQWISSTIGDSGIDLFYVCISADSNKDVQSIFGKILAGNPFVFNQRINENAFMKAYLQDVRPLNSSFSLHASANLFMNCMYATLNETQDHCLFKYSVETGTEITVFTRPRGMIKRSRSFCYNAQSQHLYEFGVLEQTSFDNSGKTSNSMFVLSDNTDSPASGITCFGQDISASTETVAIMICVRLPGLYKDIIESSEVSTWTCPQQKQPTSHTTSTSSINSNDNTVASPSVSAGQHSSNGIPSENTEDNKHEDAEYDPKEKHYRKFCDSHDCSLPNEDLNIYSKAEKNTQDDPLQKSEKVSKSFDEMVTDIQQQETMQIPTKHKKESKSFKRTYIHLRSADDEIRINKYLLKTDSAVLGLFCRDGCTHCQKAKNEMHKLSQKLELLAVDIVISDITNPYLQDKMAVSWTPFIRYKSHGASSTWIDYTGSDYKLGSIMKFLHKSMTSTESGSTITQQTENEQSKRKKRSILADISRAIYKYFLPKEVCPVKNRVNNPHYIAADKAMIPNPNNITDVIIRFETTNGEPNLKAYDAQPKNPKVHDTTIGYGFNLNRDGAKETFQKLVPEVDFDKVKTGQEYITKKQARKLLDHDITEHENRAKLMLGDNLYDSLPPNVKSAVISAVYRGDLGPKTADLMKEGKWRDVGVEYLNHQQYKKAKELGIIGVRTRMNWNLEQFNTMIKE
ncbi:uncharacterized protein LOC134711716 isoform X2 [Mytilus trossulus]